MEVIEEGRLYTYRYAVTTRMTPALRWAAIRAILMFHYCEGQSHKTVSTDRRDHLWDSLYRLLATLPAFSVSILFFHLRTSEQNNTDPAHTKHHRHPHNPQTKYKNTLPYPKTKQHKDIPIPPKQNNKKPPPPPPPTSQQNKSNESTNQPPKHNRQNPNPK